ncbi:hypothetical protein BC938DRAFT_471432, partial [Jimgerdemannia flammicorona]
IPIHVRSGVVLPAQYPAMTTYETNRSNYFLIVAFDANQFANGHLYADDGVSIRGTSTSVQFTANAHGISGRAARYPYHISQKLEKVRVWGLNAQKVPIHV